MPFFLNAVRLDPSRIRQGMENLEDRDPRAGTGRGFRGEGPDPSSGRGASWCLSSPTVPQQKRRESVQTTHCMGYGARKWASQRLNISSAKSRAGPLPVSRSPRGHPDCFGRIFFWFVFVFFLGFFFSREARADFFGIHFAISPGRSSS